MQTWSIHKQQLFCLESLELTSQLSNVTLQNELNEDTTHSCKLEVFRTNVYLTGRNGFGSHSTGNRDHMCRIPHFQTHGWIQHESHFQVFPDHRSQLACILGGLQSRVQMPGRYGSCLLSERIQDCMCTPLRAGSQCGSPV